MRAFSLETYCINNSSKDVVAWVLVLVVLVSVWIGHLIILRCLIGIPDDIGILENRTRIVLPLPTVRQVWPQHPLFPHCSGSGCCCSPGFGLDDQRCLQGWNGLRSKIVRCHRKKRVKRTYIDTGREPRSWRGGLHTSYQALNKAPTSGTLFLPSFFGPPVQGPVIATLWKFQSICLLCHNPSLLSLGSASVTNIQLLHLKWEEPSGDLGGLAMLAPNQRSEVAAT